MITRTLSSIVFALLGRSIDIAKLGPLRASGADEFAKTHPDVKAARAQLPPPTVPPFQPDRVRVNAAK